MILHADGNSFYASCEQIYRPDLRNKPVVVLSNNDGVIVALNKEAKALGLSRGIPYYKADRFCQKNHVTVFSSNYTLYADISRRITSIYMEYAPEIEEYSIDESFLFFPNSWKWKENDYYEVGQEIKQRIIKEIGIPICVGGGPTKTLAKLFNKKAKSHGGVFIYNKDLVDDILKETPPGEIWGIGHSRADILNHYGIKTAFQLKNMSPFLAKKLLTLQGLATVQELNGIPYLNRISRTTNDSVTSSRQFSKLLYDIETIECALTQYTQLAVEKLRKQNCQCSIVHVYLSTCNYAYEKDFTKCYSNGTAIKLSSATNYTPDILRAAIICLRKIFRKGFGYKTVMITLSNIQPAIGQGILWEDPSVDLKKRHLMETIDKLSQEYDRTVLNMAKGLISTGWENKRSSLSPCWTTKLSDIPKIY